MADERDIATKCDAAVVIQSLARTMLCRRELASMKEAAAHADDCVRRSAAAVVIQSFVRSGFSQRVAENMKNRNREHNRMAAAIIIQSKVRS
eukprot:scaffold4262_cov66-Skeletonema_menzelii.AAC.1